NDWQRKTYAVLRMMEDGTLFNGCDHVILRKVLRSSKSKPPYYGVHELTFTIEELRRHYTLLVAMLNEMVPLAAGLADGSIKLDDPRLYPNPHRDCSWDCKFLDVCPMFDDGGAWQWMLDEFFEVAVTLEETPE
ncbi:MAG TPA: hypothetical protein VD926_00265, partial [Acidimicrobiales bacterium]|nr:hypothetical protein [Acidimicrobiales bacterium]